MAAKSIRKSLSFDASAADRDLLAAIAAEQERRQCSFSDLCKQILRHELLETAAAVGQSPTNADLQAQIAQLAIRVEALEQARSPAAGTADEPPADEPPADPVITRLASLIEDF